MASGGCPASYGRLLREGRAASAPLPRNSGCARCPPPEVFSCTLVRKCLGTRGSAPSVSQTYPAALSCHRFGVFGLLTRVRGRSIRPQCSNAVSLRQALERVALFADWFVGTQGWAQVWRLGVRWTTIARIHSLDWLDCKIKMSFVVVGCRSLPLIAIDITSHRQARRATSPRPLFPF